MATRTISNAGGNFNATATWVEGIVPIAGDAVVATATSGNLTVNVASGGVGLLSFIMTNYTGVLTMTNTLTISGTLTLVPGMGTILGTAAIVCNATATLTSGGNVIPSLSLAGTSRTYTLADNFQVGTFGNTSSTTSTILNGNTISISRNATISRTLSGTTNMIYNAPISTTQIINCQAINALATQTFNAAGSITISGYTLGVGSVLTYTAGTILSVPATSIIAGSCTLNTDGITWNNITLPTIASTIVINSTFTANGTVTSTQSIIYSGTSGFDYYNFTSGVNNTRTYTFVSGVNYRIRHSILSVGGTSVSRNTYNSSTPGTKAILTVDQGATIDLQYLNVTDIDSSLGREMYTRNGVLNNTLNWRLLVAPLTIGVAS